MYDFEDENKEITSTYPKIKKTFKGKLLSELIIDGMHKYKPCRIGDYFSIKSSREDELCACVIGGALLVANVITEKQALKMAKTVEIKLNYVISDLLPKEAVNKLKKWEEWFDPINCAYASKYYEDIYDSNDCEELTRLQIAQRLRKMGF